MKLTTYYEKMTPEQRERCKEVMWRDLNRHGIYNEEQLDAAIAKQKPLNFGLFFTPAPGLSEEGKRKLEKAKEDFKNIM